MIALGEDGCRSLRAEVAKLVENVRPLVQRRLVDDKQEEWPHLKPQNDPSDPAFHRSSAHGNSVLRTYGSPALGTYVPERLSNDLTGLLNDVNQLFLKNSSRCSP